MKYPGLRKVVGELNMDRISNMLSMLKNASMVGKPFVELFYFKQGEEILKILKSRNLIKDFNVFKEKGVKFKSLHVDLAQDKEGRVRLLDVKRVSKPGRRIYFGYKDINMVKGGLGVLVVSTSRGFLSGEEARRLKLGGEAVCEVSFSQ